MSEIDILIDLFWELNTDADYLEVPYDFDTLSKEDQIKALRELLFKELEKPEHKHIFDEYIEVEHKERVRKRLAGESNGFGNMI